MKKFWAAGVMLRKISPSEREPLLQMCITEHVDKVLASQGLSRVLLTPEQLAKAEEDTRAALVKEWKLDA
jgi:hypothetical protein